MPMDGIMVGGHHHMVLAIHQIVFHMREFSLASACGPTCLAHALESTIAFASSRASNVRASTVSFTLESKSKKLGYQNTP